MLDVWSSDGLSIRRGASIALGQKSLDIYASRAFMASGFAATGTGFVFFLLTIERADSNLNEVATLLSYTSSKSAFRFASSLSLSITMKVEKTLRLTLLSCLHGLSFPFEISSRP